MSLEKTFNKLAGKIVSNDELRSRIEQSGVNPDAAAPSEAQLTKKILQLQQSGQDTDLTRPTMYLRASAAKEIEREVLQVEEPELAIPTFRDSLKARTSDLYLDVLPAVKAVVLLCDDKKIVDAYIKAAEECTDHRSQVSTGKLKTLAAATAAIVKKLDAKF